ncbi:MAG: hypothetical protein JW984_00020 [Deltaproteobacteria bacterium]|uniref:Uncharacterized protein n=1 Tax=Candidatus Zymogenus saltonus TaxID=2844893 RepID=A0A9D8PLW5_9DELT|nr:hypothetical protein [Candidatus Zymogenus saltonus]
MEYIIDDHRECIGCGKDGFILRGYEKNTDGPLTAKIKMDKRTEGWVGLPHGGFGMGAIMELASGLPDYPDDPKSIFPLRADFRMGGTAVALGDEVTVTAERKDGGATGVIRKEGVNLPYISGDISFSTEDAKEREAFEAYLPSNFSKLDGRLIPLPYYTDCFVCGAERKEPGLKRKFHLFDDPEDSDGKTVVSLVGFEGGDGETFFRFRRGEFVHLIAPLALGDETTGWGGFFIAKNGGVSVRLSYNFYREIRLGEKIVFFGRGSRMKGDISKRLLFWATGGAAAVDENGAFETVLTTSGQWFGLPALTDQMHIHLIPEEYRTRAFEMADS